MGIQAQNVGILNVCVCVCMYHSARKTRAPETLERPTTKPR